MRTQDDNELEIIPLSSDAYASAIRVADAAFGPNYIDASSFRNPDSTQILLGAHVNDALVAFAIAYVLGEGLYREKILDGREPPEPSRETELADFDGKLGVLKTVAVHPDSQGRGVGTSLVDAAERLLCEAGADVIVVPAWKKGDGQINVAGVVTRAGYTQSFEMANFWKQECDAGAFDCEERQKYGACLCAMVLFQKKTSPK